MMEHWFWLSMIVACLTWYMFITGYVAYKGAYDIRSMLNRLKRAKRE